MSSVRTRRLLQEVDDTYRRSLTGGFFYLLGWLILAVYAGAAVRQPLAAWGVTVALLALSLARIVHRPPSDAETDAARMQRWLSHHWSIVIASSVVWSGAFAWAVVDPGFAGVRTTAMLCTIALATAIAHAFSMRRDLAFIAIGILYLPGLVALWQYPEERANTLVMTVYFASLLSDRIHSRISCLSDSVDSGAVAASENS